MFRMTTFELLEAYRLTFELRRHCTVRVQQTETWRTGVMEDWSFGNFGFRILDFGSKKYLSHQKLNLKSAFPIPKSAIELLQYSREVVSDSHRLPGVDK